MRPEIVGACEAVDMSGNPARNARIVHQVKAARQPLDDHSVPPSSITTSVDCQLSVTAFACT